jgi:hypothetical protein
VRLSKLQCKILELAVEQPKRDAALEWEVGERSEHYARIPDIPMCDWRWRGHLRIGELAALIYGVRLGHATAIAPAAKRAATSQKRYRSAINTVARAVSILEARRLVRVKRDNGAWVSAVTATRKTLDNYQTGDLSNSEPIIVTRCRCGAVLDAARSTRRYCSAACRQAAFRLRQIEVSP